MDQIEGAAKALRPNSAFYVLRDDFTGGAQPFNQGFCGETGWDRVRTGDAGGEVVGVASESQHPGIVRISTSASQQTVSLVRGNNGAGLAQGHDLTRPDQVQYFEFIVKTGTSVGLTTIVIGLQQDALTANGGTAGVYFYLQNASDTTWQVACRTGSSSTVDDTGVTGSASTWYKLQATRSGSSWSFTVNGSSPVVINTTIPTSTFCQMGATISNQTSADRTLDVDYFGIVSSALTR